MTTTPFLHEFKQKAGYGADYNIKPEHLFGIEVEVESTEPIDPIKTKNWTTKADGSLRYYGYEFVSPSPLLREEVPDALSFLCKRLKKHPIITDSPRTSVHIHRNAMYLPVLDIWTIATAYWVVEELLFKMCGPFRSGNLFCLKNTDAKYLIMSAVRDVTGVNRVPFGIFDVNDHLRYSGLNLTSILRFGSMEFRGMAGIYDPDHLQKWIDLIDTLFINAPRIFKSPQDVLTKYHEWGPNKFLIDLLGEHSKDLVRLAPTTYLDMLKRGAHNTIPLAYALNWDNYSKKICAYYETLKGLDDTRRARVNERAQRNNPIGNFLRVNAAGGGNIGLNPAADDLAMPAEVANAIPDEGDFE